MKDDDPDIAAIEQAIGTKDRAKVQGIVDRLFAKALNLLESNRWENECLAFA